MARVRRRSACPAPWWSRKLDHARADHDGVVAAVAATPSADKVLPVLVPVRERRPGDRPWSTCSTRTTDDERRDALIEGIIEESEDEGLMDRYLAGEEVGEDTLVADLEKAMAPAPSTR